MIYHRTALYVGQQSMSDRENHVRAMVISATQGQHCEGREFLHVHAARRYMHVSLQLVAGVFRFSALALRLCLVYLAAMCSSHEYPL